MGLVLRQSTIVNGTNTITVKGSALSYIEGDSNFIHLLTNMSGSTISITGSNVGILSTNTTINGTVKFPSITNSNNTNLVTYNSSTGQLYYFSTSSISVGTASYVNPLKQDVIITGSLNVTQGITGSLLGTSSYATTSSYSLTVQGGLNNYIPLWTGSTQLTSSVLYQSGSRIGISLSPATLPVTTLQVNGNITVGQSGSNQNQRIDFIRADGQAMTGMIASGSNILQVGGGGLNFTDIHTANTFTARFSDYTANSTHALTTAGGLFVSGTSTVYSNIDYLFKVIGDGGSGVMNINNVLQVSGSRTTITGSLIVSGSQTFIGSSTSTGTQTVTGSLITSGSQTLIGTTTLTGSLLISGSQTFIGNHILTGSIEISGSSVFRNSIFTVTGSSNFSGSMNIQGDLNVVSGSGFYRWGNKLFNYAQFANTGSISVTQNVSGAFAYTTTYFGDGVSVTNGSRITFANSGLYNIQFSALANQGVGSPNLHVWFKKTGSNIDNSDTLVTLANNSQTLLAWNFAYPISASEYIEIWYHSNTANTSFPANAAGSGFPLAPSIITTVTQIA